MRRMHLIMAVIVLSTHALSQTTDAEQLVKNIVSSGSYSGFADKQLGRMGDAAAVTVTKVVAGKDLTPEEIDNVLIIAYLAFSKPALVENLSDREPRTMLFMVRYLDSSTSDLNLKQKIAAAREHVQRQYTDYLLSKDEKERTGPR